MYAITGITPAKLCSAVLLREARPTWRVRDVGYGESEKPFELYKTQEKTSIIIILFVFNEVPVAP